MRDREVAVSWRATLHVLPYDDGRVIGRFPDDGIVLARQCAKDDAVETVSGLREHAVE